MGEINDRFAQAYRDFSVSGVPASGEHEPEKAEIRAIGGLLEGAIASAGSSLRRYATTTTMNADTAQAPGTLAYVYANAGSPSDPANGFYQWSGSAWVAAPWFFDGATAAALDAVAVVQGEVDTIDDRLGVAEAGIVLTDDRVTATEGDIAGLTTGLGSVTTRVTATEGDVDALDDRLTPIEGVSYPAPGILGGRSVDLVSYDDEGRSIRASAGPVDLEPDGYGLWTYGDSISGPAASIIAGIAPDTIQVDVDGRPISADGGGASLKIDATGWNVAGRVAGPAPGVLDKPTMPGADAFSVDTNGRMIPMPSDSFDGPAAPILGNGSPEIVSTDANARTVLARLKGFPRAPDGFGGWTRLDRYEGPAPGIVGSTRQEGAAIVVVDSAGRRMRSRLDSNVEVVSTPTGEIVLDGAGGAVATAEPGPITFTTPTIAVPAATIERGGGVPLVIPAGTVTSPLPSIVTITGEAVAAGVNQQTFLSSESLIAVSAVRRASDGVVMTAGTDYTVELARGIVTNKTATALVIDYTAYRQRKDIITADPVTFALTITLGQERPRIANVWAGTMPAGHIEIGRVFNSGAQIIYTPTWRWRAGHHVARRADDASMLELCRRAVRRTRSRLAAGLPVRLPIYGDSRMEMGGNGPAEGGRNVYPNSNQALGFSRDTPGFFALYDVATRTRAGILPAVDFGDGYAAIHAREGYAWRMARRLEDAYGVTFDAGPSPTGSSYRNWAIGGTDSSATLLASDPAGNQRANGLHPTRWGALKADIIAGQTLLVIGFGMNEIGSTATYGNLVRMATEAKALGAEVMMIATTRPDPRFSNNVAGWRFTCRETVRAAIDTGSAWVDPSEIVSPENLVGLGLSEPEVCDATEQNHDGVAVQDPIGDRAFEILI